MSADECDDEASRARVQQQLGYIDQEQAHLPTCVLCGQRTGRPDAWGLCSKISPPHVEYRDTHSKVVAA